jgi:hypothetical protein
MRRLGAIVVVVGCREVVTSPETAQTHAIARPAMQPSAQPSARPAAPTSAALPISAAPTRKLPGPCAQHITWNGGGKGRGIVHHRYDAQGRVILNEWDGDADGKVTERTLFSYPDANHVEKKYDYDADGTIDKTETVEYGGNLDLVLGACGTHRWPFVRCDFDAFGNLLRATWDPTKGAVVSDVVELDYTCWK